MSLAWWNGRMAPSDEVQISPADAGFLMGDGLFETLRVEGGQAREVGLHLDRLFAGLDRIGIELPEDRETLADAIDAVARDAEGTALLRRLRRLRITITRGMSEGGPTRLILASPYSPPPSAAYREGVPVIVLLEPWIDSRSPLAGLKSLSYQANRLALARAEAAGAFEALMLNERGRLVEGSRSNLIVALEDGLFTPPVKDGCLPGTVRRRLLESGVVTERSLGLDDLSAASEAVLTNSLIGVLPVGQVDGRKVAVGTLSKILGR